MGTDASNVQLHHDVNYTMTYKPGKDIPVTDALSRLPTDEIQNNNTVPIPGETVMFLEHLDTTPVTSQKIATWTKRDTVLSQGVLHCYSCCSCITVC